MAYNPHNETSATLAAHAAAGHAENKRNAALKIIRSNARAFIESTVAMLEQMEIERDPDLGETNEALIAMAIDVLLESTFTLPDPDRVYADEKEYQESGGHG